MPVDNTEVFEVPQGNFFAMGDNRDNSRDSRLDLGYVPTENLVGRADRRFISLTAGAHLWEIWRWPWTLRFSRFFVASGGCTDTSQAVWKLILNL